MPDPSKDLESFADLAAWAEELAAAVTPDELDKLVKDYREQGRNPQRSVADRKFAKRRGDALAKVRKRSN